MNTLKKLDKMFGKYVGIAFSLLLIWIFKNDPGNLTYQIFFMSLLVSGFIFRELVVKHKNKINKSSFYINPYKIRKNQKYILDI